MQHGARHRWTVMGATLAGCWWLSAGESAAANIGMWAPVGTWVTGLTALAWAICGMILVFGVVKTLMGLTTYREEGMATGLISGASVITGAVIAFIIIPPLLAAGLALGATLP